MGVKRAVEYLANLDKDLVYIQAGAMLMIIVCLLALMCVPVIGYFRCQREAEFYNRLTGENATISDAFFLDLDPSKHAVMVEQRQIMGEPR